MTAAVQRTPACYGDKHAAGCGSPGAVLSPGGQHDYKSDSGSTGYVP